MTIQKEPLRRAIKYVGGFVYVEVELYRYIVGRARLPI